jgi:hypothetical protein
MNNTASKLAVGETVVSGNTFRPTYSEVTAINLTWADLTADEQKTERTIAYQLTDAERAAMTFVRLYTASRHKSCRVSVYSTTVFNGTHYASWDAMFEAYEAKRAS